MSMDLGELCLWPLENLADSHDKKGKLRQVRINEIPAKNSYYRWKAGSYGEGLLGESASTPSGPGVAEHVAARMTLKTWQHLNPGKLDGGAGTATALERAVSGGHGYLTTDEERFQ